MNLIQLENLFIEKLTEKYKLTKRDIKRAFAKFDTDGSGYLSVSELTEAIHLFLNGVSRELVAELVRRYDVDQDGTISVDEFSSFLLSRNSEDRSQWLTVDHLTAPSPASKSSRRDARQHVGPDEHSANAAGVGLDYRERLFLQTVKSALIKDTLTRRNAGTISKADRLGHKTNSLVQKESSAHIENIFAPLTVSDGGGLRLVPLASFKRVLRRFASPGTGNVGDDVLESLFDRCCRDKNGRVIGEAALPSRLYDLVFDEGGRTVDQFGFVHEVRAASDTGRPKVESGPLHYSHTVNGVDSDLEKVTPHEISDVPFRFVTRRCRTSLAVPSNFRMSDVARSARSPDYECYRDYVFGFKAAVTSGSPIHSYPLSSPGEDRRRIIYAAGSLGIVHDLDSNRQTFFEGHDDDVTCIAVAPGSYGLVATGQLGRRPSVCVWDCSLLPTSVSQDHIGHEESTHTYAVEESGLVTRIGVGFFMRAVCAVTFSYDAKYICAIGCDDHHAMGIWEIRTGELIADVSSHNGTPPQICSLTWCPAPQYATYINKTHNGESDVICTTGVRHLKFWSFVRPTTARNGDVDDIAFRSGTIGKVSVDKPKIFKCASFLPPSPLRLTVGHCDLVTGGDNGFLYLFRKCVCVAVVDAFHKGVVSSLCVADSMLVCGGSRGAIVHVDSSNMQIMQTFSALPDDGRGVGQGGKDIFGAPSGRRRPSSAPGRRTSSTAGGSKREPDKEGAGGGSRRGPGDITRKGRSKGPTSQWDGPRDHRKYDDSLPTGVRASTEVQGLVVLGGTNDAHMRRRGLGEVLAVTGFGKVMKVDTAGITPTTPILSFHYGPTWAVSVCGAGLALTGGDDRWLCMWDYAIFLLVGRCRVKAPIRCVHSNTTGSFVAVGMVCGVFSIYYIEKIRNKPSSSLIRSEGPVSYSFHELDSRRDCVEDISDIKFSPNEKMVAVGSHDNFIDIYATDFVPPDLTTPASCNLRRLKRLRGHTSYITHLDWSDDNKYIQSTCGAYELLYWDMTTGKQALSSFDSLEADTTWNTSTCVLGFNVMGIWPKFSDGTDVNAVDVNHERRICATGDDSGYLNLFNYPCVTKDAPRKTYGGHSSHVMNVKFAPSKTCNDELVVLTCGGNDNCVMVWAAA